MKKAILILIISIASITHIYAKTAEKNLNYDVKTGTKEKIKGEIYSRVEDHTELIENYFNIGIDEEGEEYPTYAYTNPDDLVDDNPQKLFRDVGEEINSCINSGQQLSEDDKIRISKDLEEYGYKLMVYKDNNSGTSEYDIYYEIYEDPNLIKKGNGNGWGTYFFNIKPEVDVIIECPHCIFDQNIPYLAASVFLDSEAKAFLMSGAQRNVNGKEEIIDDDGNPRMIGIADVCKQTGSIFHIIHTSLSNEITQNSKDTPIVYQIHGYNSENSDRPTKYPQPHDIIISSGQSMYKDVGEGEKIAESNQVITDEILYLDEMLEIEVESLLSDMVAQDNIPTPEHPAFCSYAFNDFIEKEDQVINAIINKNKFSHEGSPFYGEDSVPGITFRDLGGRLNEQGKQIRANDGKFLHIEVSDLIRFDETGELQPLIIDRIAMAIKENVRSFATRFPLHI